MNPLGIRQNSHCSSHTHLILRPHVFKMFICVKLVIFMIKCISSGLHILEEIVALNSHWVCVNQGILTGIHD
jgi:hypothetical protein